MSIVDGNRFPHNKNVHGRIVKSQLLYFLQYLKKIDVYCVYSSDIRKRRYGRRRCLCLITVGPENQIISKTENASIASVTVEGVSGQTACAPAQRLGIEYQWARSSNASIQHTHLKKVYALDF